MNYGYCQKCNHIIKTRKDIYQHRCSICFSDRIYIFRDYDIFRMINKYLNIKPQNYIKRDPAERSPKQNDKKITKPIKEILPTRDQKEKELEPITENEDDLINNLKDDHEPNCFGDFNKLLQTPKCNTCFLQVSCIKKCNEGKNQKTK